MNIGVFHAAKPTRRPPHPPKRKGHPMRNDDNYYGYHNDYDSGMLYLMEQPALRPLGDAPV